MTTRHRRDLAPGSLVHVISRIAAGEFRIAGPAERGDYLQRVPHLIAATDWVPLAYALMSNHVHWAFLAGAMPLHAFIHPLHTGFARALNLRDGRFGHVFADRPYTVTYDQADTLRVVTYIHNNPVRAGVCADASETQWTSHRAVVGEDDAPPWLDVARTLSLCGFGGQRAAFHTHVEAHAGDPRDLELVRRKLDRVRAGVRVVTGSTVEVGALHNERGRARVSLFARPHSAIRVRWDGALPLLLRAVCRQAGIGLEELQSSRRDRWIVRVRRLVLWTGCRELGRSVAELAAALGISAQGASQLLAREPFRRDDIVRDAEEVAERLRKKS